MTTVINFFGGPGTGKSTMAAFVTACMKFDGVSVEYVDEEAKALTWESNQSLLSDQLYLAAQQHRKIARVADKVDFVVTDSPLLMGLAYANPEHANLRNIIIENHQRYKSLNFLMIRHPDQPYDPVGRNQTEEEAKEKHQQIDTIVRQYLTNGYDVGFHKIQ